METEEDIGGDIGQEGRVEESGDAQYASKKSLPATK